MQEEAANCGGDVDIEEAGDVFLALGVEGAEAGARGAADDRRTKQGNVSARFVEGVRFAGVEAASGVGDDGFIPLDEMMSARAAGRAAASNRSNVRSRVFILRGLS
jgi:hypothetical protein